MNNQNPNDIDKLKVSFKILIMQYLDLDTDQNIPLENPIKIIAEKKNSDKITNLEKILFHLIENVNPLTSKFREELNIFLSLNALLYLKETKAKNTQVNAKEVYMLFTNNLMQLKDPSIAEIFFKKDMEIVNKIELYLELVINFITTNQIDLIINVLKKKFQKEEVDYIKSILDGLDLKIKKSFIFVKDILLIIINKNSETDLTNEIKNVKENYLNEEKNVLLHCNICYNPPILEINNQKEISINYLCAHVKKEDVLNPENITNYKIKCACCKESLLNIYKNYLCSNCKNIFCKNCLQNHFSKCLNLFFIPLSDIGSTCTVHNKHYELFCSICNLNLCSNCKDEHQHYSHYGITDFVKEDKTKVENLINKDEKNNKAIISLIKQIISNNNCLKNLQYQFFLEKLLGRETGKKCGTFEEFGDKNFNEYYSNLIRRRKNGSLFYIRAYEEIKNSYENASKKINDEQLNLGLLYEKSIKSSKIYTENSDKKSLLFRILFIRNDLLKEISSQETLLNNDIMKIRMAKYEIKNNSLLNANNKYKSNIIKLLNRSIADNIIRYLVLTYPYNFKKIDLDSKIYINIKEAFKDKPSILQQLISEHNEEIIKFSNDMKSTENENNEDITTAENTEKNIDEEEELDDNEDLNFTLIFEKPIKINNQEISTDELNDTLNYLFYIKDIGNLSAHPKNNPNSIKLDLYDNSFFPKNDSDSEYEKFIKTLGNSFRRYKFIKDVSPDNLLEFLFDEKFDKLLNFEEGEKSVFKDFVKSSDLNQEIIDEFKQFDKYLDSFESLKTDIESQSTEKINRTGPLLQDFFKRLTKLFNNEETAFKILDRIFKLEINNSSIGENYQFISDCFNYILRNMASKYENLISNYKAIKNKLIRDRSDKKNLLELLEKLNQKADQLYKKENENNQKYFLKGFIDYLNKDKSEEEKKDYSEAKDLLAIIRNDLEKLLSIKISWTNYDWKKLSSLLFLKQNKYI